METAGAKFPKPMLDRLDDYAEERDLNRSQAIRQLVEDGFEAQEESGPQFTLPLYITWLGTMAAAAGLLDASQTVGIGGLVIAGAAVIYQVR